MVNDPAHSVGAAIQERYDRIADAVDPPNRGEVLAFLHGTGPLRGRWFGDTSPGFPPRNFWWRRYLSVLEAPIPMVLHCPACGTQHIDQATEHWPNPPHRSHLCGSCGCIWRPADVPTVGVERVATVGKADNWPLIKEASELDELEPLPLQAVEPPPLDGL